NNFVFNNSDLGFYAYIADRNLFLNNRIENHTLPSSRGFYIQSSPYNTIQNNIFYSNKEDIYVYQSNYVNLTLNNFSSTTGEQSVLARQTNFINISNNRFSSVGNGVAIYLDNNGHASLLNNTVQNALVGLLVSASSNSFYYDNKIYNTVLAGIVLEGSGAYTNDIYQKNRVLYTSTGIFVNNSNNNIFINNLVSYASSNCVVFEDSKQNSFIDGEVTICGGHGIEGVDESNNLFIYNNSISSCGYNGIDITNSSQVNITFNKINNNLGGVSFDRVSNGIIDKNTIRYNAQINLLFVGSSMNNIYQNYISNSYIGIYIEGGCNDNNISENTIASNTFVGNAFEHQDNTLIEGNHYYNNSIDIFVNSSLSGARINFTNNIIDRPQGDYQNYTIFSLYDVIDQNTAYALNWSVTRSSLPSEDLISFRGRYIDIIPIKGSTSIDYFDLSWRSDEITGYYNDSRFQLWVYSSGSWSLLNDTPDIVNKKLSITDLVPASGYGILQNISGQFVGKQVYLYAANITNATHLERWGGTSEAGNIITEGGNITIVNLFAETLTDKWAGLFGNVTGDIYLTDNDSGTTTYLFKWVWAADNGGAVCVSANSALFKTNISGAYGEEIDSAWGFNTLHSDSGKNTFSNKNCSISFGAITVDDADYAETGAGADTFRTCVFKMSLIPKKSDLIFCSEINESGVAYTQEAAHYELIVPTTYGAGTETYYFYLSLN
ncbi:MAG: NosD domain-containing protein, partial [Candidatus Bilamarchaeaceae archaeon]